MKLFFLNTGDGYSLREMVHTLTQTHLNKPKHTHTHTHPVFGLKTTVPFHFSAPPRWRTLRHRWNMSIYDSLSFILLVFSLTILQFPLRHLCVINPKTALILMCITMTQPLKWKNDPSDAAHCTAPLYPGNRILPASFATILWFVQPFYLLLHLYGRMCVFSCHNLHIRMTEIIKYNPLRSTLSYVLTLCANPTLW